MQIVDPELNDIPLSGINLHDRAGDQHRGHAKQRRHPDTKSHKGIAGGFAHYADMTHVTIH